MSIQPREPPDRDIHQYAITGLNFSSWAARRANREISAALSGAGMGVVMGEAVDGEG